MVAQQTHGGAHISRKSALWICCGQRVDIQGVRPEQANQRKTPPDERPSDGVSLEELCRVETGQHPPMIPAIFDRNMAGRERSSVWRITLLARLFFRLGGCACAAAGSSKPPGGRGPLGP